MSNRKGKCRPGLRDTTDGVLRVMLLFAVAHFCYAADPSATIRFAGAPRELVVNQVSSRTVRITLWPLDDQGRAPLGKQSAVLVDFPMIEKGRFRELAGPKTFCVGDLRISVKPQPFTISVHRTDGKPIQKLVFNDSDNTNSISFQTDTAVLGLGEGAYQFDRRGEFYPMVNGQIAPFLATHGATIPVPFLIGTGGWAMFVHQPWGQFDLRGGKGRFLPSQESLNREPVDIFITSAPNPADALGEFIRLTGHLVMPPKWVMGYLQSHRTLAGPDEPLQIAKMFREKQLPCDALIYLGTGYCTNGWNVINGTLDFNPGSFPKPTEELKALQAEHFKVILHVNQAPRNLFGTSMGIPFTNGPGNVSVTQPKGPYLTRAQRQALGVPVATGTAADFSSPLHIRNYWAWHRDVFGLGVDGWWPDDGDELPIEARLARHLCYYAGPLLERPNARPWSLHRNGYAGIARYGGWIWSGDVQSTWATLAAHVPVALNCSISLSPFWGSDTGGFIPTREYTGELYARWFQFSAFNPLFRSHGRNWHLHLPWGWNAGETGPVEIERDVTDPAELHNAAIEPICRKYLELRYRLLPYNYTLMREACDTGLPPMRALWLHYPNDPQAVQLGDEYLWGRDLLIAPVVEKGATSRRVYLPEGKWFDWWTGEAFEGKRWMVRTVDLATMPIYVRAGAIVPLDPIRQFTAQEVSEPTTLRVHTGANGDFILYDDNGQTLGYRDGSDPKTVWIHFLWKDAARKLTIEPDSQMKKWTGAARLFRVEFPGTAEKSQTIVFQGKAVTIKF